MTTWKQLSAFRSNVIVCQSKSHCVEAAIYLDGMDAILSPVGPKASLNLLSHLAAKAELTVAGGLFPPEALPACLDILHLCTEPWLLPTISKQLSHL